MNLMVLPNQLYLIVKLYNNCPELLPDTHVIIYMLFPCIMETHTIFPLSNLLLVLTIDYTPQF